MTIDETIVFCKDMDWSGSLNMPELAGANDKMLFIFGSLTLIGDLTWSFNGEVHFKAFEPGNFITSAGIVFPQRLFFEGNSGEWTLLDNFATAQEVYHTNGTLRTNGMDVSIRGTWNPSCCEPFVNPILDLGTSTSTVSNVHETRFSEYAPGNVIATQSHIIFDGGGAIKANNQAFGKVTFQGDGVINQNTRAFNCGRLGSGNSFKEVIFEDDGHIFGNNTFGILSFTPGKNYILEHNSIQTITPLGDFNAPGIGGFPIEIKSCIPGSQATIHKDGDPVCLDYLFLTDIKATGTGFSYAGANSDDVFNNDGFIFEACPDCFTSAPAAAPVLDDAASILIVPQGNSATLVLESIPAGSQVVWFDATQTNEVYAGTNLSFQPSIDRTTTFFAAFRELATGCVSELLAVRVNAYAPLSIQVLTDASECPDGATGKATVYASGGAQSRGKGHFIYTDEWYNNNQIGGNDAVKGDFNSDGYEGLFFSDYVNGPEILFNDGDGTFTLSEQFIDLPEPTTSAYRGLEVEVADFDLDGDLDVFGGRQLFLNDEANVTPYQYTWSSGHTTREATNLAPGTYTVIVTDADGNSVPASVEILAPDVNNSKSVTTLDLIQLRKLILSVDTRFKNNTSWRFIPAAYEFRDPANPWGWSFLK